jgi:hypothetical protein
MTDTICVHIDTAAQTVKELKHGLPEYGAIYSCKCGIYLLGYNAV